MSADAKVGLIYGDEDSDTKVMPFVVNEDAPASKFPGAPIQDTGKTVVFVLLTSELFEIADKVLYAIEGWRKCDGSCDGSCDCKVTLEELPCGGFWAKRTSCSGTRPLAITIFIIDLHNSCTYSFFFLFWINEQCKRV